MKKRKNTGFTLTELLITVAIIAILAVLAVPSFQNTIRSQRAEGAAEGLMAALQNAKAEAIKSNNATRIVFTPNTEDADLDTWCYGIAVAPAATCDCTANNSCLAGSVVSSADYSNVIMHVKTDFFRSFNPLRGTSNGGTILISAGNNKTLGVTVSSLGRIRICKPNGSTVIGYSSNGACP